MNADQQVRAHRCIIALDTFATSLGTSLPECALCENAELIESSANPRPPQLAGTRNASSTTSLAERLRTEFEA